MDTALLSQVLESLLKEQVLEPNQSWPVGTFKNYRSNQYWAYKREDNSIFYTAWIVKILQEYKPYFTDKEQVMINSAIDLAISAFNLYKNKDGLITYNFYPTRPSRHFGNGLFFHRWKHFQLPDDADDTALIYQCMQVAESDKTWLAQKLASHTVGNFDLIKPQNRNKGIYSTWFGKNMPIEHDMVVISNCLLALSPLPKDNHQFANWTFLKEKILDGSYILQPFYCAPNYANTIVIAYHIANLLAYTNWDTDGAVAHKVKEDLMCLYKNTDLSFLQKVLIESSLYKLGVHHNFEKPIKLDNDDIKHFSFFMAGMLNAYANNWAMAFKTNPFWHIQWTCPAHSMALVIENLCLKNKKSL